MDQRRIGDSSLLTPQELEWLEQNPQSVASATTSSIATRPVALEPSRTYYQIDLQSGLVLDRCLRVSLRLCIWFAGDKHGDSLESV
jgi:hypothetical protein